MIGNEELDQQNQPIVRDFGLPPLQPPMQQPVEPMRQTRPRVASPTPRQPAPGMRQTAQTRPAQKAVPKATPTPKPTPTPTPTPRQQATPQKAQQPQGGRFFEGEYDDFMRHMLRAHEGLELKPYIDTQGYWTVGIGHRLDPKVTPPDILKNLQYIPPKEKGKKGRWAGQISAQQAQSLFDRDYVKHAQEAKKYIPNFDKLPINQKMAFVDMVFNMGGGKFNEFKKLKKAITAGDVNAMVREMKDSLWYNQTHNRARNLTYLVQTGQINPKNQSGIRPFPTSKPAKTATPARTPEMRAAPAPGFWDSIMTGVQNAGETIRSWF